MGIPNRIREIESEIDSYIRELPIWKASKDALLGDIMGAYRDGVEVTFVIVLHALTIDAPLPEFGAATGLESQVRAGMLWALKWASEYCPLDGQCGIYSDGELEELLLLGAHYEVFVDALKRNKHDLHTVQVDERQRTITFYEGGPVTAYDSQIVQHQRIIGSLPHVSLTEDGDQLTARWTAGDYRRVTRKLRELSALDEKTILVDPVLLARLGKPPISMPQPTLVWFERPAHAPDCYVFDDLTLPRMIDDKLKWKLVSFLDRPVVQVRGRYCAVSTDIMTISRIDDYMLRLAAQVDNDQYNRATTLREERMIGICKDAFEKSPRPWTADAHLRLTDPLAEIDILATRLDTSVVLQLKSTLFPETPWEVYKRNEDIINGVQHTKRILDRGAGKYGFVVTDGYRGDFSCWAEALAAGIPIATLDDLDVIASDPAEAVSEVKARVGITHPTPEASESPGGLLDREWRMAGWTFRLVDDKVPPRGEDDL